MCLIKIFFKPAVLLQCVINLSNDCLNLVLVLHDYHCDSDYGKNNL